MAGCNCKNKNLNDTTSNDDIVNNNPIHNSFIVKVLIMGLKIVLTTFIGIISIPFIILFTEYMLFKTIVFSRSVNFDKIRDSIAKKLKFKDKEEDDDDDDDEENHEEYEYKIFDVEEINEGESKKV